MRINYDFLDLEAFLAVRDSGSFLLAADRLGLSQSAVTRRIAKLEAALDSKLFERTTRSVKPTLAAKRLQMRAEAILDQVRETSKAMRDESIAFSHQRGMVVTVAIVPTVVPLLIPAALREMRSDGFVPRIRILDLASNEVEEAVAQGEAEFGISSLPAMNPMTSFEILFEDRIVLALPQTHPLAGYEKVPWSGLEDKDLILPARGTGNRALIDEAFARLGSAPKWTIETKRTSTALALAEGGSGIALVPWSAAPSHPDTLLTWLPTVEPDIRRPVGLLSRVGQSDLDQVAALKSAIRRAARRLETHALA